MVLHFDIQPDEPLHQELCLWATAILIFTVATVPANSDPSLDRLLSLSPHLDVSPFPFQLQLLLHF